MIWENVNGFLEQSLFSKWLNDNSQGYLSGLSLIGVLVNWVEGTPDVPGTPSPIVHRRKLTVSQTHLPTLHSNPFKRILHLQKWSRNLIRIYLLVLLYLLFLLTLFLHILLLLHFLLCRSFLHFSLHHLFRLHLLKTILQMSWFIFYHQFLIYYYIYLLFY